MYRTAEALRDAMVALGVACDGGKDSLSMAANAAGESVMAPGNLVISAYVACTDVRRVLTPDLKAPGNYLLHVDLGKVRLHHCLINLATTCALLQGESRKGSPVGTHLCFFLHSHSIAACLVPEHISIPFSFDTLLG